jgi:uncharacterized membrane protein
VADVLILASCTQTADAGDLVGALIGAFVGVLVGALVGVLVGTLVGTFVGALVGCQDPPLVGTHTGEQGRAYLYISFFPVSLDGLQYGGTVKFAGPLN